jgi:hypothetical protein
MAIQPLPLNSEFLFRMVLTAGTPQMATGAAARGGELRVIPVTGGTFEGPALKGELVPGTTADWLRVEGDGTAHMDVRLVMRSDRGQLFYMQYWPASAAVRRWTPRNTTSVSPSASRRPIRASPGSTACSASASASARRRGRPTTSTSCDSASPQHQPQHHPGRGG